MTISCDTNLRIWFFPQFFCKTQGDLTGFVKGWMSYPAIRSHWCFNDVVLVLHKLIWPNGIIFHQPRFPWNFRKFPFPSYLLGAHVVWGCYKLTRLMVCYATRNLRNLRDSYHPKIWLKESTGTKARNQRLIKVRKPGSEAGISN